MANNINVSGRVWTQEQRRAHLYDMTVSAGLYPMAQRYNISGRGDMDKEQLVRAILRHEVARFGTGASAGTGGRAQTSNFGTTRGFNVKKESAPPPVTFTPYSITIEVKDEATDRRLKSAMRDLNRNTCSSANWVLNPVLQALGLRTL